MKTFAASLISFLLLAIFCVHGLEMPRNLKVGELYEGIFMPEKSSNWTII